MRHLLLIVSLLGHVALGQSAHELCATYFSVVARASHAQETNINHVASAQGMMEALRAHLTAQADAFAKGAAFASGPAARRMPYAEIEEGHAWSYRSGAHPTSDAPGAGRYYEPLAARALRIQEVLANFQARETFLTMHYSGWSIRKVVENPEYDVKSPVLTRRTWLAAAGGLVFGAITGPVRRGVFDGAALTRYDRAWSAKALSEVSQNRETHLARVRDVLGARLNADKAMRAIYQNHVDKLDVHARAGSPYEYGSRLHEYLELYETKDLDSALNSLASRGRSRFTVSAVTAYAESTYHSAQETRGFKNEELTARFRLMEERAPFLGRILDGIVSVVVPTLVGGAAGKFAPIRGAGEPRRPAPELAALAELLSPDHPVTSPIEWAWLGANTLNGKHTDLILKVEYSRGEKLATLLAVSYETPLGYWSAKDVATNRSDRASELADLREKLIAKKNFRLLFGKDLAPVEALFTMARSKRLGDENLAKLNAALAKAETMDDVRRLSWVLETMPTLAAD